MITLLIISYFVVGFILSTINVKIKTIVFDGQVNSVVNFIVILFWPIVIFMLIWINIFELPTIISNYIFGKNKKKW